MRGPSGRRRITGVTAATATAQQPMDLYSSRCARKYLGDSDTAHTAGWHCAEVRPRFPSLDSGRKLGRGVQLLGRGAGPLAAMPFSQRSMLSYDVESNEQRVVGSRFETRSCKTCRENEHHQHESHEDTRPGHRCSARIRRSQTNGGPPRR